MDSGMSRAATLTAAMRSGVNDLPQSYWRSQTAMGNHRSRVVGAVGTGRDALWAGLDALSVA